MEVRKIREGELEEVELLEKNIFTDPWSRKSLKETYAQKQAVIFGVWKEGRLIGYAIIYYVLDECEIARIGVDASFRRQGAAGCLIAELKDMCEGEGIVKIMLDVRESNKGAIAFYKSQGFLEDGRRKSFYVNPRENAVLMSLESGKEMAGVTALPTGKERSKQI